MSNNGNNGSSKTRRSSSIEALMKEGRWDDVRKRLKRISSPTRIGELLFHSADDPNVPEDILECLLSKLQGQRNASTYYSVNDGFWEGVCCFKRQRGYKKRFEAVCRHRSVPFLRMLLKGYAEFVGTISVSDARKTICYLWTKFLEQDASVQYSYTRRLECSKAKENKLFSISSIEDLQSNEELQSLWEKTELLIKLTKVDGLNLSIQELPLVHTLIQYRMPKVVVWLALRLYPAQVKFQDAQGRLPLHWASVLNNDTESYFEVTFTGKESKILEGRMVEVVLDFFPQGARYADTEGSLPLTLLLDVEYTSWTLNKWTRRCAQALMKQAPEALTMRNTKNLMLPFMTAASIHENNTVKASSKREEQSMLLRKMNLAYAVLRADPSVVASGISESLHEKHLKKKLEDAQSEIKQLKEERKLLQAEIATLKGEGQHSARRSKRKRL